jgi:hypothetical protein
MVRDCGTNIGKTVETEDQYGLFFDNKNHRGYITVLTIGC